jgi:hypothetical protein
MIKTLGLGIWVSLVTLGAAYGAVQLGMGKNQGDASEAFGGLDYIKTEIVSVPVIRGGDIQGYVVLQFVFAADTHKMKELTLEPGPFLIDEAFRTIYAESAVNFRQMSKVDLEDMTAKVRDNANKRMKADVIRDVLVQQFNYVPKEEARANLGPQR